MTEDKPRTDDSPSEEQILTLATQLEGHPDNVAPALLGGLVIVVRERERLLHSKIPTPPDLEAALFVPELSVPTEQARRVLPQQIPLGDAVHNLGRVALLVSALFQKRYEFLDVATRDRLHQPYRQEIFPAMPRLFAAARQAGALGVFLSGAGSTILALCRENAKAVAEAMAETGRKLSVAGQAMVVPVTSEGAQTEAIELPHRRWRRREAEDHW